MTWIEVCFFALVIVFGLFFSICYSFGDCLLYKSKLLWLEFLEKREEIYNHYPWLESKSRIKRRLKHKEFLLSTLEDD